tara:strand:+ start:1909 stop:2109 length:201 start_codon:yes stop_codon:yes gene_type:complete
MKTLDERSKLKAEFRAWKEEIALWQEQKPSFRIHNPIDYKRLLVEWQETKDAMIDAANLCIQEAKS